MTEQLDKESKLDTKTKSMRVDCPLGEKSHTMNHIVVCTGIKAHMNPFTPVSVCESVV